MKKNIENNASNKFTLTKTGEKLKWLFWNKIGSTIVKIFSYPIRNPLSSKNEVFHDIKVGFKDLIGQKMNEEGRKYSPPMEIQQDSKNLGIKIEAYEKGRVLFSMPKLFTGDISKLTDEQIGKIQELNKKSIYFNISIDREKNKIVFEIDTEKIIADIKADPKNHCKTEEEIKKLVIGKLIEEIYHSFKSFAEITGGELKNFTDERALLETAERLYQEYETNNKTQLSPTIKSSETINAKSINASEYINYTSDDSQWSMTNPIDMPFNRKEGKFKVHNKGSSEIILNKETNIDITDKVKSASKGLKGVQYQSSSSNLQQTQPVKNNTEKTTTITR